MSALTQGDLQQVLASLRRLHEESDLDAFPQRVLDALRGLVGSEITCYTEMNPGRGRAAFFADPQDDHLDALLPVFARFQASHPRLEDFVVTRTCGAKKISDFVDEEAWHARPIYDHFFGKLGLEDQITIMMPAPPPIAVGVALNRTRRDFSERDRAVLDLLVPHVSVAYRNAVTVDALRQACRTYERALEELSEGIVLLSPEGDVLAATRTARERLGRCFPAVRRDGHVLPGQVASWIRTVAREHDPDRAVRHPRTMRVLGTEEHLVLRLIPQTAGHGWLLLLEEQRAGGNPAEDPRVAALPPRLRKVFDLLLTGDGEKQVAAKLELSRHTVHDYVKQIYRRLDVSSRSELLALWLPGGTDV